MMDVVKLPANSHALISLYLLYSHTCWIPGKHYQSLYKALHADTCDILENYIFLFHFPLDNVGHGWHGDFTNLMFSIPKCYNIQTQHVSR